MVFDRLRLTNPQPVFTALLNEQLIQNRVLGGNSKTKPFLTVANIDTHILEKFRQKLCEGFVVPFKIKGAFRCGELKNILRVTLWRNASIKQMKNNPTLI